MLVYELFVRDLSAAEVKTLCLMKWNSLKVLASLPDHRFLIKRKFSLSQMSREKLAFSLPWRENFDRKSKGEQDVALSARQIQQATSELDFLDSFALTPVRISHIGRHKALAADFEKVPFEQYLYVDNLFQGYLNTQDDGLLLQMAQVLYGSDHVKPTKAHLVGIFYWMASAARHLS